MNIQSASFGDTVVDMLYLSTYLLKILIKF